MIRRAVLLKLRRYPESPVKEQVFGMSKDTVRAFWKGQFVPKLSEPPQTRAMLMRACNVRLPGDGFDVMANFLLHSVEQVTRPVPANRTKFGQDYRESYKCHLQLAKPTLMRPFQLPERPVSLCIMTKFKTGAAFFDGQVLPLADAGLPLTDWGLTHSDIAYDVVPVWQGAFFRLDDYVDRFHASMSAARMDVGMDRPAITHALHQMVAATGLPDAYVAMVAARGRNPIPGSRDPRDCVNHFYAWCVPYVHIVSPEEAAKGTSIWIAKSVRRIPKDSVDPRVKNYHWGDFTSGLFEAKDNGFETTLLLDHQGNVTEGPGFNVFAVFGDKIVTSNDGVLHGITRRTVLEMCSAAGLATETRALPLEEFWQADEVFLSSSGGGVIPVARVDDRSFSNASAGPVALDLRKRYFEWISQSAYRTPVQS